MTSGSVRPTQALAGEKTGCLATLVLVAQATDQRNNVMLGSPALAVVGLSGLDDQVYDTGKTPAAFAAFFHGVIDLQRNNQAPLVLVEQGADRIDDLLLHDHIAAANDHSVTLYKRPQRYADRFSCRY